jgi:hypothetical protein
MRIGGIESRRSQIEPPFSFLCFQQLPEPKTVGTILPHAIYMSGAKNL